MEDVVALKYDFITKGAFKINHVYIHKGNHGDEAIVVIIDMFTKRGDVEFYGVSDDRIPYITLIPTVDTINMQNLENNYCNSNTEISFPEMVGYSILMANIQTDNCIITFVKTDEDES